MHRDIRWSLARLIPITDRYFIEDNPAYPALCDVCEYRDTTASMPPEMESTLRTERLNSDLRFGWNMAKFIVRTGVDPSSYVECRWIVKAVGFLQRDSTYLMDYVVAIDNAVDKMKGYSRNIHAMCVCPNMEIESIAAELKLKPNVISAYTDLFFDMMDRRDEPLFLEAIVWPYGRIEESDPQYAKHASSAMKIMRTAYGWGLRSMLLASGLPMDMNTMIDVDAGKKLESTVLNAALMFTQAGGVNDPGNLALIHARQYQVADKQGGHAAPIEDELSGLVGLGFINQFDSYIQDGGYLPKLLENRAGIEEE